MTAGKNKKQNRNREQKLTMPMMISQSIDLTAPSQVIRLICSFPVFQKLTNLRQVTTWIRFMTTGARQKLVNVMYTYTRHFLMTAKKMLMPALK